MLLPILSSFEKKDKKMEMNIKGQIEHKKQNTTRKDEKIKEITKKDKAAPAGAFKGGWNF